MTPFTRDEELNHPLDWQLLQTGPVTLVPTEEILDELCGELGALGYQFVFLDATGWSGAADFHEFAAAAFGFPDYYGRNLNAFADCLGDVEVPSPGGLFVVFRNYDSFVLRSPGVAQAVLDVLADRARHFLLFGLRFGALVHSADPTLAIPPVGATAVSWYPPPYQWRR